MANSYPINMLVYQRPCLVVGGGNVAVGKVRRLVESGAQVTVVAPTIHRDIAEDDRVSWIARTYRSGEVVGYRLVITCTDDPFVNAQVFADGEAAGVLVNSADDIANCAFTLPAVVQKGDLQVAISTNGRSPAMASWLRQELETLLGPEYETLLELLGAARTELRHRRRTSEMAGWRNALDGGLLEKIEQGDLVGARSDLCAALALPAGALR